MAMFENISVFFKRFMQNDKKELVADTTSAQSKDAAKERLHVVLMQDRANVSADFLEMMKEEILDVIKKYIVIDESQIDVRLTNQENEDGSMGAPLLHANIPIINIRNDVKGEYLKEESTSTEENKTIKPVSQNEDKTQIIEVVKELVEESKPESGKEEKIDPNKDTFEVAIEVESSSNSLNDVSDEPYDDEADDDVTFDDLLKAAEEEERQQKSNNKKVNNKNNRNNKNNNYKNPKKKNLNKKTTTKNKKTPSKNNKTKKEV